MASGDFGAATHHYSSAIAVLDPLTADDEDRAAQLHILYSNRAQARLNGRKYIDAIADCTRAIELNPKFLKSFLRRAATHEAVGNEAAAKADYNALVKAGEEDAAACAAQSIDVAAASAASERIHSTMTTRETERIHKLLTKAGGEEVLGGRQWVEDMALLPNRFRLPQGIVVEPVSRGTGAEPRYSPALTSQCLVHYEGKLRDGKVFDSSIARGVPATFAPADVIEGWKIVLQLMTEGDVWNVWIPTNLAYSARGAGAGVPPFAALQFEIRLLSVLGDEKVPEAASRDRLAEIMKTPTEQLLAPAAGVSKAIQ